MSAKAPREDYTDADIEVSPPKTFAAGIGGVYHSMEPAIRQLGVARTAALMAILARAPGRLAAGQE